MSFLDPKKNTPNSNSQISMFSGFALYNSGKSNTPNENKTSTVENPFQTLDVKKNAFLENNI